MVSMTGYFVLDWMILAVSLFNTIILLWLGLTIFLNADRHNLGVWLMSGGLLVGSLFFMSHTAILGQELTLNIDGHNFWWQIGWLLVTIAPFAWYVVMLWFNGFWSNQKSQLYQRHRIWFVVAATAMICFIGLILTTGTIPSYEETVVLDFSGALTLGGIPVLLLIFPTFMVLCILLSLDVLAHPIHIEDVVSSARQRSRPWLLAAGLVLLLVSLIVAIFIVLVIRTAAVADFASLALWIIGLFDMTLATLISIAIFMMGQAIVTYEVFTGKVLPRRRLAKHWRNIIFIAVGYSTIISWSLIVHLRMIYSLGLATLMMVIFYALYSWQSFNEHDVLMRKLRPFVSSQDLVSHLLTDSQKTYDHAMTLFYAVCMDILATGQACLVPVGAYASLIRQNLIYPENGVDFPREMLLEVDNTITKFSPKQMHGYEWGIPLRSERGLIGFLIMGGKSDGGIYSQEEIDVAQQAGERILDMIVGETMGQKLMEIQRQRMAQTRIVDTQTQRILHDEVLPLLHTAILELSPMTAEQGGLKTVIQSLTETHQQIARLIRKEEIKSISSDDQCNLVEQVQMAIQEQSSEIVHMGTWIEYKSIMMDSLYCEVIVGAIRELIRNALTHGQNPLVGEEVHVQVDAKLHHDGMNIYIIDDGFGFGGTIEHDDHLISGNGLNLYKMLLSLIGGKLEVEMSAEQGTTAIIFLPSSILQSEIF